MLRKKVKFFYRCAISALYLRFLQTISRIISFYHSIWMAHTHVHIWIEMKLSMTMYIFIALNKVKKKQWHRTIHVSNVIFRILSLWIIRCTIKCIKVFHFFDVVARDLWTMNHSTYFMVSFFRLKCFYFFFSQIQQ